MVTVKLPDIMSGSITLENIILFKWSMKIEKCLCELKNVYPDISCFFYSFSYRGKVIIKGVSNIIGFGYSITIIKGE